MSVNSAVRADIFSRKSCAKSNDLFHFGNIGNISHAGR